MHNSSKIETKGCLMVINSPYPINVPLQLVLKVVLIQGFVSTVFGTSVLTKPSVCSKMGLFKREWQTIKVLPHP